MKLKWTEIKRLIVMPFARRKQLKDISSRMKSVKEILDKEIMLHEGYLKHQKNGNSELMVEYKFKRDALRWVLNKDE
jgi:hypothetical protein